MFKCTHKVHTRVMFLTLSKFRFAKAGGLYCFLLHKYCSTVWIFAFGLYKLLHFIVIGKCTKAIHFIYKAIIKSKWLLDEPSFKLFLTNLCDFKILQKN